MIDRRIVDEIKKALRHRIQLVKEAYGKYPDAFRRAKKEVVEELQPLSPDEDPRKSQPPPDDG